MENKYLMMHILDVHTASPFKDLFMIRPADLANITEEMKKNGYDTAHPIVIWGGHKGVVVDGHTRLQAAKDAGLLDVAVIAHDFADEDEALEYAIGSQRNRRNLTPGEMLECLNALDSRKHVGRPSKTTLNNVISGRTAPQTAKLLGTSQTKVERLRAINAHATPEVKQALKEGKMTINKAYGETMSQQRQEEKHLPGYDMEKVKAVRLQTLEKDFEKIILTRIEREVHEHPDIEYTEQERGDLIARCLPKIEAAIRNLPLQNSKQNSNDGEEK